MHGPAASRHWWRSTREFFADSKPDSLLGVRVMRVWSLRLAGLLGSDPQPAAELHAAVLALAGSTDGVDRLVLQCAALLKLQRLQERMGSLRGKSHEIGEIVNLTDTIAFRTHVLALNASVEACKAGDAGRGFAVVAQAQRALATRSADSARRISRIVTSSTQEIEQSGVSVRRTHLPGRS